jgi:hypothetical protein
MDIALSIYTPVFELKYSFRKKYRNIVTGEIVEVHTNRIEGSWKHAKDHFKKMSGTKGPQFEGHLAEIMWRSQAKSKMYPAFFDLLKSIYTLQSRPVYMYTTPLFDTWSGLQTANEGTPFNDWEVCPVYSDAATSSESSSSSDNDDIEQHKNPRPGSSSNTGTGSVKESGEKRVEYGMKLVTQLLDDSSSSSDNVTIVSEHFVPKTTSTPCTVSEYVRKSDRNKLSLTKRRRERGTAEKVCCPAKYEECSEDNPAEKSPTREHHNKNPYTKSAFVLYGSSDDDFE